MNTKSKRQQLRERQRNQKFRTYFIWGAIGVAVLSILGIILRQGARPEAGEPIPVMTTTHIATDSDPGTYNSNPPTSGPHYAEEAKVGFHDSNNYKFPAGYLVHNLEHGYVIFWYNCDLLDETACAELKSQIKSVMEELGGVKLIAYPWPSLDVPLAITSWGRLQIFESFDAGQAKAFYRANLNSAPEPNAP